MRYRTLVQLGNSDIRLVEIWKQFYGGGIRRPKYRLATKEHFAWHLEDGATIQVLKDILPYLIHKREKALKALEFAESIRQYTNECRALRKPRRLTQAEKQRREELIAEFKQLE